MAYYLSENPIKPMCQRGPQWIFDLKNGPKMKKLLFQAMISSAAKKFDIRFPIFFVQFSPQFHEIMKQRLLTCFCGHNMPPKLLFHFLCQILLKIGQFSGCYISGSDGNFQKKIYQEPLFMVLCKISKNKENLKTSLPDFVHFCPFFSENGS